MRRLIPLALLLSGCATVRDYATCDNARAAVVLAEKAVDKICYKEIK